MKNNKEISGSSIKTLVDNIISSIKEAREREIVSRRFGLYERKETLEQIGEMLGITRERVRQLEKIIITQLSTSQQKQFVENMTSFENLVLPKLSAKSGVMRVTDLTQSISDDPSKINNSRVAFLAKLSTKFELIDEDDFYYSFVFVKTAHDEKEIKDSVNLIVNKIIEIDSPQSSDQLSKSVNNLNKEEITSLALLSKQLASLNGLWGLVKWPSVNPKNIRDKIYVILKENGKYMHFNEIAEAIRNSNFKRNNVTTQAIHNELIKDKRFILIGRGLYALKEWGYKKGTVSDIITEVLKEASKPLHKDEIVKRVLDNRYVKETTVILNLQGKPQFKRVAKATYELSED